MRKSMLIRCTESDLVDLGWCSQILDHGNVCRHVGYPIGVDISPSQILNWISFRYWKYQGWSFGTLLNVAQAINDSNDFLFFVIVNMNKNPLIIWLIH